MLGLPEKCVCVCDVVIPQEVVLVGSTTSSITD